MYISCSPPNLCWYIDIFLSSMYLKIFSKLSFCNNCNLSATFHMYVENQELRIVSVDGLTARVHTTFYAKLSPQQDAAEIRNNEIHIELLHSGSTLVGTVSIFQFYISKFNKYCCDYKYLSNIFCFLLSRVAKTQRGVLAYLRQN